MSDQTDTKPAPAPSLLDLAKAFEEAQFEHAARLEKSNASAKRAQEDQKAESDALQLVNAARDALVKAATSQ